ncbi:hypothetical protein KCQ_11890 [Pectobacterium atrosepticum ICMP 1526]|nr:hypothetical protein KCQ_11890 [Pectobacterium atrosepticum ICMP 1526]
MSQNYYGKRVLDIGKPMGRNIITSKKLTFGFIKKCYMPISAASA